MSRNVHCRCSRENSLKRSAPLSSVRAATRDAHKDDTGQRQRLIRGVTSGTVRQARRLMPCGRAQQANRKQLRGHQVRDNIVQPGTAAALHTLNTTAEKTTAGLKATKENQKVAPKPQSPLLRSASRSSASPSPLPLSSPRLQPPSPPSAALTSAACCPPRRLVPQIARVRDDERYFLFPTTGAPLLRASARPVAHCIPVWRAVCWLPLRPLAQASLKRDAER